MANSDWATEAFGPAFAPRPSNEPRTVQGVRRHTWPHLHPATALKEAYANHGGRQWVDKVEAAQAEEAEPEGFDVLTAISILNPAWQKCYYCGTFHPVSSSC